MKRLQPQSGEVVAQLLEARFVADRRVRIGSASWGLGGVFPTSAMDLIEVLGLGVVRFQIGISEWPGR